MPFPSARLLPALGLLGTCGALAPLSALETELRVGPEEIVVGGEILSADTEYGALRHDDTVLRAHGRYRTYGVGFELEGFVAMGDDDRLDHDAGEVPEIRARLDYVFEIEDYAQIVPNVRTNYYPAFDDVDEPVWVGLEVWYLLPIEGLEVGGSLNVDATGEHGFFADLGARQIIQHYPLDLQTWQVINFGNDDFHGFTSGAEEAGLGTISIGALATLPLPAANTFATLRVEGYAWIMDDDRDVLADDHEFVVGVGFEWRP